MSQIYAEPQRIYGSVCELGMTMSRRGAGCWRVTVPTIRGLWRDGEGPRFLLRGSVAGDEEIAAIATDDKRENEEDDRIGQLRPAPIMLEQPRRTRARRQ